VGGAIVTIALNFALIPFWGYMGSAWASLACYVSMTAACYAIGQKRYPIPYKVTAGFAYILLAAIMIVLSNQFTFNQWWTSIGFHGFIMLLYVMIVYYFEREKFRDARSDTL